MSEHSPTPWTVQEIPQKHGRSVAVYSQDGQVVLAWSGDEFDDDYPVELYEYICRCVNSRDQLVKCLEHLKYEAKYSRDDGMYINEVLAKAKGE